MIMVAIKHSSHPLHEALQNPIISQNNIDMIVNTWKNWSNAWNVLTMVNLAIGQLNVYTH
jgi:hypothetical protein